MYASATVSPNLVSPGNAVYNQQVSSAATSAVQEVGRAEGSEGAVDVDVEPDDAGTRIPVFAPRPKGPTQAEIAAHEPLHLEYRSWCPACVAGRGHSAHHTSGGGKVVDEPTWHMDYSFMSDRGEVVEEQEANPGDAFNGGLR